MENESQHFLRVGQYVITVNKYLNSFLVQSRSDVPDAGKSTKFRLIKHKEPIAIDAGSCFSSKLELKTSNVPNAIM